MTTKTKHLFVYICICMYGWLASQPVPLGWWVRRGESIWASGLSHLAQLVRPRLTLPPLIFPSTTLRFWLWMTCWSGKNYFPRSLMTFQCIWDELLLMMKLRYLRPTMSEMVGTHVSYAKLSRNLSVTVVVS